MIGDEIKAAYTRTKWALVLRGVFGLVLGFFIYARPLDSVAAFALVIAFWALIDGISNIVRAFNIREIAPHWWVLLLTGIVSFAFGVAALYYYPGLSLTFAVVWTAFWLFTAGLMGTYVAIQERRFGAPWGWTLALGILSLAAGVLAYMYPNVTLAWLLGFIAAYGILSGVILLLGAWKLQSMERQFTAPMRATA
ncbi:MAG TPA: DUF308 domain-containing protein [Gemmatimonadaceae bacterium]|nr:DUF308 domain-containing protein [Gemmatimonadaceae bacterium]